MVLKKHVDYMKRERECERCKQKFTLYGSLGKLDCPNPSPENKKQDHFDLGDSKMAVVKIQDLLEIILNAPNHAEFFNRVGVEKENGIVRRRVLGG